MNAQKNIVRRIEKDINNIKKRSQEDIKDIKDYKKQIGDDIIDIKKEVNSLKVELMKIKSDLLKEKEFDKVKTSEATSETQAEEETKDNIAKGYWWW
jgi:regulator of replication initiation timing